MAAGPPVITSYIAGQSLNVRRHLEALRDFRRDEFGTGVGPAERGSHPGGQRAAREVAPSARVSRGVAIDQAARTATVAPTPAATAACAHPEERAHDWVRATEKVWDFYFELFGQRQSAVRRLAARLRSDRPGLLPARLHAPRHRPDHPGTAAVRVHAHRILAGDLPARHSAAAARPAAQPVPAWSSCPITAWSTRGRWARSCTRSATTCRTSSAWQRDVPASILRRLRRGGICRSRWPGCGRGGTARSSATCSAACSAARRSSPR